MEAAQKTIKDVRKGFKKTKIGWIPEDWEVNRKGESAKIDAHDLNSKTNPKTNSNILP